MNEIISEFDKGSLPPKEAFRKAIKQSLSTKAIKHIFDKSGAEDRSWMLYHAAKEEYNEIEDLLQGLDQNIICEALYRVEEYNVGPLERLAVRSLPHIENEFLWMQFLFFYESKIDYHEDYFNQDILKLFKEKFKVRFSIWDKVKNFLFNFGKVEKNTFVKKLKEEFINKLFEGDQKNFFLEKINDDDHQKRDVEIVNELKKQNYNKLKNDLDDETNLQGNNIIKSYISTPKPRHLGRIQKLSRMVMILEVMRPSEKGLLRKMQLPVGFSQLISSMS